jgi:hypothetical protein
MMWVIARPRRSLLLAAGSWTPTRLGFRSCTRIVPTPMLLFAPTFVEDYISLIRPTTTQHTDQPKPVLCVHRVAASDPGIDPTQPAPPLSQSVVAPIKPPWSSPSSTYVVICSLYISPAVDLPAPPTVDRATLVSILDDRDKMSLDKSTT